ncbi:MAG: NAD(P)/FAD-dependent oxidoreductase [Hyphomicrobium sp.]
MPSEQPSRRIAVVGAGVSGLSCAWLLSQAHEVTLYEADDRLGGHSNTVDVASPEGEIAVDTGFIVYNEPNYPNLAAMFDHLGVVSKAAHMSFAVSVDGGAFEYSSHGAAGLFAQKRNLTSPRFWAMLADLKRFHRQAPLDLPVLETSGISLGEYLNQGGYGRMFMDHHLLPQAAAIWSASSGQMADYPAAAFVKFYRNHRLLEIDMRPNWRTVDGGSRVYVSALKQAFGGRIRSGDPVLAVSRDTAGASVFTRSGAERFDAVVLAVHPDQALRMLEIPTGEERRLLGAIPYQRNRAVLHRDIRQMPRRRAAWAAWNHVSQKGDDRAAGGVTYWMNQLQSLPGAPLMVTLNPLHEPRAEQVLAEFDYEHPVFNAAGLAAQQRLWTLQGHGNVWFCGAWFGAGFHEDGLQAGLAVAEQLGGVRRPWSVADESGRIVLAAELTLAQAA